MKCSEANKYVDATYKIIHILRSVYATNMILEWFWKWNCPKRGQGVVPPAGIQRAELVLFQKWNKNLYSKLMAL